MVFTRQDKIIAVVMFIALSSVYFASSAGINSSNDGSHYAAIRAISDTGSFEITPYLNFTEQLDYAIYNSNHYSDKAPGTALFAAVFYKLGQFSPRQIGLMPSKHDPENSRLAYAVMAVSVAGASAAVTLYLMLRRHFKRSPQAALVTALAAALGTLLWRYSAMLFAHALGALAILIMLFTLFETEDCVNKGNAPKPALSFLAGFFLAFAGVVEYTSAPTLLLVAIYATWIGIRGIRDHWSEEEHRPHWFRASAAFLIGALIPTAFLLIYNTSLFGGPLQLSAFHVDETVWPHTASLATALQSPLLEGLMYQLFYWDYHQGVFILTPVALFSLLGWANLFRQDIRRSALLLSIFAAQAMLFASYTLNNTGTFDARYMTAFVPLWLVPIAFWYDKNYESYQGVAKALWGIAFFSLLFLSVQNQLLQIAYSLNYGANPSQLIPQGAVPHNLSLIFGTVFRNLPNLPLLWLVEAIGAATILLVVRLLKLAQRAVQPTDVTAAKGAT